MILIYDEYEYEYDKYNINMNMIKINKTVINLKNVIRKN